MLVQEGITYGLLSETFRKKVPQDGLRMKACPQEGFGTLRVLYNCFSSSSSSSSSSSGAHYAAEPDEPASSSSQPPPLRRMPHPTDNAVLEEAGKDDKPKAQKRKSKKKKKGNKGEGKKHR